MVSNALQDTPGGEEAFLINSKGCETTIKAFQGGYCYKKDHAGNILDKIDERHPYEDVMDCLIYWFLETEDYIDLNDVDFEPRSNINYVNPYTGL